MHAVNLGEVFYDGLRRAGSKVEDLWKDVLDLGMVIRRDSDSKNKACASGLFPSPARRIAQSLGIKRTGMLVC